MSFLLWKYRNIKNITSNSFKMVGFLSFFYDYPNLTNLLMSRLKSISSISTFLINFIFTHLLSLLPTIASSPQLSPPSDQNQQTKWYSKAFSTHCMVNDNNNNNNNLKDLHCHEMLFPIFLYLLLIKNET